MLAYLVDRTAVTETVFELTFELPRPVMFTPGQFARVETAPGTWRDFSIIDADGDRLRFLVDSRYGGGAQVAHRLRAGAPVEVQVPMGSFTVRGRPRKVLIATGTGLAPFVAVVTDAIRRRAREYLEVLFGCRGPGEDLAARYIPERAASPRIDLTVCTNAATGSPGYRRGRVTDVLRERDHWPADTEFYVCGNSEMVREATALLEQRSCPHVFTESY